MQFIELREMPLPDSENSSFLSVYDEHLASPRILGQVCGHWRAGATLLWSTVNIRRPTRSDVRIINFMLERPKQAALALSSKQSTNHDQQEQEATDGIMSLLLNHR